jgi:hypothetical protein
MCVGRISCGRLRQTSLQTSQRIPAHMVQLMQSARTQGMGEEYRSAGPLAPGAVACAGWSLTASGLVVQAER